MNKKIIALLLGVLVLIVSIGGCSSENKKDKEKLSIVTTIFPQYDFLREITKGVDNVEVKMLLKPGQESHDYDPSSKDIMSINDADMFVYVGGESDEWVDDVLKSVDKDKMTVVTLMDSVKPVEEEVKEGMDSEHHHEDGEEHEHEKEHEHEENDEVEYDEHVWTSPANAIAIVEDLRDELCRIDNDNSKIYKKNSEEYINKLKELDSEIRNTVDNGVRKTIVVADRFPLRYFCDEYGLDYYAAFPGCSTSTEPSSNTLIFLTNKVKELNIPCIFTIEMSNKNVANHIANETNVKILEFNSCHNVSKDDYKAGKTYLDYMHENLNNLKEALN